MHAIWEAYPLNLVQEMVSVLVFGKDKNNFILAARLKCVV